MFNAFYMTDLKMALLISQKMSSICV